MKGRGAFTLIEILLAVAILGTVATIVGTVLGVGTEAWRATAGLAEETHDGDAVMEQIAMALRSAYYPTSGEPTYEYGFQHEDDGDDESARDSISWVKIGATLVGEDVPWAGSAHRVQLFFSQDEDGQGPGLYAKAWQMVGEPEDFDPDEDAVPVLLSDRVVGLDCRMQDPEKALEPGEPYEWIDEWTESNRIPASVRITLALAPQKKGADPDVMVRLVEIPMSATSWNPSKVESTSSKRVRNGPGPASGNGSGRNSGTPGGGSDPGRGGGSGGGGLRSGGFRGGDGRRGGDGGRAGSSPGSITVEAGSATISTGRKKK